LFSISSIVAGLLSPSVFTLNIIDSHVTKQCQGNAAKLNTYFNSTFKPPPQGGGGADKRWNVLTLSVSHDHTETFFFKVADLVFYRITGSSQVITLGEKDGVYG